MPEKKYYTLESLISELNDNVNRMAKEFRSLGQSINELKASMEQSIDELNTSVQQLGQKIVNVEVAKIIGEIESLQKYLRTIIDKKENLERDVSKEIIRIREDYSTVVTDMVGRFVETLKIDSSSGVKPLTMIINLYEKLKNLKEELLNRVNTTKDVSVQLYHRRIEILSSKRNEVLNQINEFKERREKTVKDINALKTELNLDLPTIFKIPFWIVGIKIRGEEKIIILPPMERTRPTRTPTREEPYSEHLQTSTDFDFSNVKIALKDPAIINFSKSNGIKTTKSKILSSLANFREKGYVDSIFVEAVEKFWR
ncbi:MAG: hypothetical protein NZ903_01635 [Candidatus Micrarchaeota archaeon]|nr:hypothetical protein [Candidatus Micrarchaeota archaeon]